MTATGRGGFSAARLDRLRDHLRGYVERGEVAGVIARLDRHGEEAFTVALGWQDREAARPIAPDTICRIASMTKPIVAVAALTLVEEGALRLFDPIDRWLPELADRRVMRDPNGSPDDTRPSPRAITLHDLLTYRIGIGWGQSALREQFFALTTPPAADALRVPGRETLDPDAWMARIGAFPLLEAPGARFRYHTAVDILGVLLARVTGQPLETALRERIFDPLGMVDTGFSVPAEKRDRLATLYALEADGTLSVRETARESGWATPPAFPSGGGGLVSTAADYQRFGQMLVNGGALAGVRVVSRKSVEALATDYLTPEQHTHPFAAFDRFDQDRSPMWDNSGFGYGVAVRTRRVGLGPSVGSLSWSGSFGTSWVADPHEGLSATLLTQLIGHNPFYTQINEDFLAGAYGAIAD